MPSNTCIEVGEELTKEVRDSLTVVAISSQVAEEARRKESDSNSDSDSDSSSEAESSSSDEIEVEIDLTKHGLDGDCPLCFEALPPIWALCRNIEKAFLMPCCGKYLCTDCHRDYRYDDNKKCPFCRAQQYEIDADGEFLIPNEAIERLERNVEKGLPWAMYFLGMQHFRDRSSMTYLRPEQEQDKSAGFSLFVDAANAGHALAMYALADILRPQIINGAGPDGKLSETGEEQLRWVESYLQRLSRIGHAEASYDLYELCDRKRLSCPCPCNLLAKNAKYQGERNDIYYLKLASEQGWADASHELEAAYRTGEYGLDPSPQIAFIYRQRAADQKHKESLLLCIEHFAKSEDKEKLYHYCKLGAPKEIPLAQYYLGEHYVKEGTSSEMFTIGMHMLTEASNGGYRKAETILSSWRKYANTHCFNCDLHITLTGVKLHKCSKCGAVAYCSKKCQVEHWKSAHKKVCINYDEWSWKLGR